MHSSNIGSSGVRKRVQEYNQFVDKNKEEADKKILPKKPRKPAKSIKTLISRFEPDQGSQTGSNQGAKPKRKKYEPPLPPPPKRQRAPVASSPPEDEKSPHHDDLPAGPHGAHGLNETPPPQGKPACVEHQSIELIGSPSPPADFPSTKPLPDTDPNYDKHPPLPAKPLPASSAAPDIEGPDIGVPESGGRGRTQAVVAPPSPKDD